MRVFACKQTQMRSCVSCREIKHKSNFFRIVKLAEGKIFVDESGKAQGRGAYVCKCEKCITEIKKRRRLDKTFKNAVPIDLYDDLVSTLSALN